MDLKRASKTARLPAEAGGKTKIKPSTLQKPRKKQNKEIKTSLLTSLFTYFSHLLQFSTVKSP